MKIGVLALQGAVTEHMKAIEACGVQAFPVKHASELTAADGLLLPGGESTAMRRLIDYEQMLPALRQFAEEKPVFGTCAGLILLAKTVEGEESHIGKMQITARRNAFGRQVASFEAQLAIEGVSDSFPAVFIRAPKIVTVGEGVEVLAKHEGDIVCARDRHLLACSFHPELTNDPSMMKFFIEDICSTQRH